LGERILAVATELFFDQGYGATSIEAIAKRAGISKRTFYHRFPDKAALFGAVIARVVERLRPANDASLFSGGTIEEILERLATTILRAALTKDALALYRVMLAEASRFPELAATAASRGSSQEAVDRISLLLAHMLGPGGGAAERYRFAAAQFLYTVIAMPQRRALGLGPPMSEAELAAWPRDCVRLFLDGCRAQR
jgi:TetR/AcrR family transcriptional regulator, mexJK operon transcriptional repressor